MKETITNLLLDALRAQLRMERPARAYDGRLKPEKLFYADIIGMTWEECKEKYLKEVGR